MNEISNCKITSTRFGIKDGILTFWVYLEGGDWCQGLGGYACDGGYNRETHRREKGYGAALIAMRSIMETVGVNNWEELPGTLCRAKTGGPGSSSTPIIGHILKDRWFDLAAFMKSEARDE